MSKILNPLKTTWFLRLNIVMAAVCLWAGVLANAAIVFADERPRIGLVLSGGGARGAAHIGVIRELEKQNVPIDYVVGTSMGAIVGGLYASGMTPEEMEQVLVSIDWEDIFADTPDRRYLSRRRKFDNEVFQIDKSFGIKDGELVGPSGLVRGAKLDALLNRLTAKVAQIEDFDKLPIPYRAVAADIATGQQQVLGSGSLSQAIRASMSIPGFLTPVEIDNKLLVDGGIANNLPVDVARGLGADVVIAVDISTPLLEKAELDSLLSIALQLTGLLTRKNTEERIASLKESDVLIVPDLGAVTTTSFKQAAKAIGSGEIAAAGAAGLLSEYSLKDTEYAAEKAARPRPLGELPIVDFIDIDNQSQIDDEVIRSHIRIATGAPLDLSMLEQGIAEIYGLGVFETVDYSFSEREGETGITVHVREKPWGPRYLQGGLEFSSDFDGENQLQIVLGYTVTPINRLGGEWRSVVKIGNEPGLATEFYQPLGVGSPYFVLPQLIYQDQRFNEFDGDQVVSENRIESIDARFEVGRELGAWGRLSTGIELITGDQSTRVGLPTAERDFDDGSWFAGFSFDTLDDVHFATDGLRGGAGWKASTTTLGSDNDFDQLRLDIVTAHSWDEHTFLLGARHFTTVSGEAPLSGRFRTGGQFDLPGFANNALTGQHLSLLRSGYQRSLGELMGFPGYLIATLQYGNVFQDKDDIDIGNGIFAGGVYLGLDTVLGPVYLGYGRADTGDDAFYLSAGNRF